MKWPGQFLHNLYTKKHSKDSHKALKALFILEYKASTSAFLAEYDTWHKKNRTDQVWDE